MRNAILIFFLLIDASAFAQDSYVIQGRADSLKDGDRIFLFFTDANQKILDSTTVSNKNFVFRGTLREPAVLARLFANQNPFTATAGQEIDHAEFVLTPSENKIESAAHLQDLTVKDSRENQAWLQFLAMRKGNDAKFSALGAGLTKQQLQDSIIRDSLISEENILIKELNEIRIQFAREYPDSYMALLGLYFASAAEGLTAEAQKSFDHLESRLKETKLGKQTQLSLLASQRTEIGKIAPPFKQQDTSGRLVSLEAFKGKYVLLDFWASWCDPCREENPNILSAYQQYKNKNFTVIGISLDMPGNRQKWLDAIKNDQLPWTQLSDLNGWQNQVAALYGVKSIPKNLLLDPKGRIIAKDIRGKTLQETLSKYLAP